LQKDFNTRKIIFAYTLLIPLHKRQWIHPNLEHFLTGNWEGKTSFRSEACFSINFSSRNSTWNAVELSPEFLDEDKLKTNLMG